MPFRLVNRRLDRAAIIAYESARSATVRRVAAGVEADAAADADDEADDDVDHDDDDDVSDGGEIVVVGGSSVSRLGTLIAWSVAAEDTSVSYHSPRWTDDSDPTGVHSGSSEDWPVLSRFDPDFSEYSDA